MFETLNRNQGLKERPQFIYERESMTTWNNFPFDDGLMAQFNLIWEVLWKIIFNGTQVTTEQSDV